MRNFVKKQSGITLIALVVTIIVLIILAGVSINMLVGDNGIINMAQRAKEDTQQAANEEQHNLTGVFESNYVTYNGQLHVEGTKLMNENNEEVRLQGAVLNNGSLYGDFNKEVLENLKSWGCNVIKVGLNCTTGSRPYTDIEFMNEMNEIIDIATDLDMYVIVIFWSGSDISNNIMDEAIDYFTQISTRYKLSNNIIYEIANEPANDWSIINNYCTSLINTIRNINPTALILCPTRGHNTVDQVKEEGIIYDNVMYAAHIYGGTDYLPDYSAVTEAVLNNIPVFISEWSYGRSQ